MIKEIIDQWEANKHKLEQWFKDHREGEYGSYIGIIRAIFTHVIDGYDVSKLTVIDDGHYQGTLIFIIPENIYQPDIENYIVTNTYYGSCPGCDTLLKITDNIEDYPTDEQVKQLMTIALHLVQKLKPL